MVLLKLKILTNPLAASPIYIPIWFYSNINQICHFFTVIWFTFQYGSTQIKQGALWKCRCDWFTFQYGSTQIAIAGKMKMVNIHLHSNMVLLKSIEKRGFLIIIKFTFQYGSTQIPIRCFCSSVSSSIYIPIWFYSNTDSSWINSCSESHLHSNMVLLKYIQCRVLETWFQDLHSNMVLLKWLVYAMAQ